MIVTDKQDGTEVRLFRVCDDDNGCDDEFDTLEEALKYAEEQVKAYRDAAYCDGEWCGSERVDVYRVIRRWSLQPVTGPSGATHDENGYEYMDLVEEELPPVLTLEMVEREAKEIEARAKRGDLGICDWVSVGAGMDRLLRRLRQQMGGARG